MVRRDRVVVEFQVFWVRKEGEREIEREGVRERKT